MTSKTLEERAREIVEDLASGTHMDLARLREGIHAALVSVRNEEREACMRTVCTRCRNGLPVERDHGSFWHGEVECDAASIRSRSD